MKQIGKIGRIFGLFSLVLALTGGLVLWQNSGNFHSAPFDLTTGLGTASSDGVPDGPPEGSDPRKEGDDYGLTTSNLGF